MRLRKCLKCGAYTLSESCKACNVKTSASAPARFSPEDAYGVYRRRMKKQSLGI